MSAKKTKAEKLESRREWYKKNKVRENARLKADYEKHKAERRNEQEKYYR